MARTKWSVGFSDQSDQITGFDDADLLILGKVLGNSKPAIALESQNLILNPELAGLKVLIRISVSTFQLQLFQLFECGRTWGVLVRLALIYTAPRAATVKVGQHLEHPITSLRLWAH